MGAAEVVPGVSGSTGALLTRTYERLVDALKSVNRGSLKLLIDKKFDAFWKNIEWKFLLVVLAGIITGFLTFSRLILYALKHNPILVGSFFFSLIFMAAPLVMREEIKKWDTGAIICFAIALLIAYAITLIHPIQLPRAYWMVFIVGTVAGVIAFIPGLSFTFILLLLGQFENVTASFTGFKIFAIFIFIAGYVLGLVGFSRILDHFLKKFHKLAMATLTGLMLGFLNKVWPWRHVMEFATNSKGEQVPAFDRSILPWNYFASTGKDPQIFQAILMMALGVFIVILIEKIASRLKTTF